MTTTPKRRKPLRIRAFRWQEFTPLVSQNEAGPRLGEALIAHGVVRTRLPHRLLVPGRVLRLDSPSRFYMLVPVNPETAEPARPIYVRIAPIELPRHLGTLDIVTRDCGNRLELAEHDHRAEAPRAPIKIAPSLKSARTELRKPTTTAVGRPDT